MFPLLSLPCDRCQRQLWLPDCRTGCASPTHMPQVYSLMNLAFAWHEIISDYTTASILWFESK